MMDVLYTTSCPIHHIVAQTKLSVAMCVHRMAVACHAAHLCPVDCVVIGVRFIAWQACYLFLPYVAVRLLRWYIYTAAPMHGTFVHLLLLGCLGHPVGHPVRFNFLVVGCLRHLPCFLSASAQ
jgi:hypothetical protein